MTAQSPSFSTSDTPVVFNRNTGHEQVIFCHDAESGLKAIIGIYSTRLGPSLGGTRFYPYERESDALADVLNLSKGMAYKNSLAGLDLGGGKAVIIGDPAKDKNEAMLRAFGRFVQSLSGRYITACDVGTYVQDMDIVARECDYVTGRSEVNGGAGDSSVLTAYGVFLGMKAAAQHRWGSNDLAGKKVGVSGVGKVGKILVGHLLEVGALPVIADVVPQAVRTIVDQHSTVSAVERPEDLIDTELDIFSPCAMGNALTEDVASRLRAPIVCGAANNQLATENVAAQLQSRDITYCPDYLVNAGGVIQVADELEGFNFERAKQRASHIYDVTLSVLEQSKASGQTAAEAADHLAEERMAKVGSLGRIRVN